MSDAKVLLGGEDARRRKPFASNSALGWRVVGAVGAALALLGGLDLVLLFVPARFGNVEWEFASISAGLNGLPVLTMGLALVTASGLARGSRLLTRGGAVLLGGLGLVIVGLALVYALTLPIALGSTDDPVAVVTIRKSVAKTVGQVIIYPTVTLMIAVMAWRAK